MTAPRLLILGAALGNVPRIRAARAAGFFTVVADDLPQPHGFAVADAALRVAPDDLDGLAAGIAALGGIDGIVGSNEVQALAAARLGRRLGLKGAANPAVIAQGLSKLAQRQAWAARAAPWAVPFSLMPDPVNAAPLVAALGGYPIVLKPALSPGGSRGVSRVAGADALAAAHDFALAGGLPGSAVLAEALLPGPQFSAEAVLRDGRARVVAIGRKVKSPEPYCVDLAVQYDAAAAAHREAAETMITALCAALDFRDGSSHVEFAATPAGLRPIELAMRCGGGLTPDLAGAVGGADPFLAECRRACGLDSPLPPALPLQAEACFRFLLFPPGVAATVDIPPAVRDHPGVLAAEIFLPADGVILPLRWTSQRSGLLGVVTPPGGGAVALAEDLAGQIRLTYADGSSLPPLPCPLA
ncbi:ATP-grasp domain-containing protein [Roseomonas sp. 18066]|uniref:ATP-grasp domain-containing protein n=1 Tax=Roseomonas sp. 18066 TaxID=2681412 RepID=UPI001356C7A4|nr:ATP-grasp domain-containing protein [Roseomonas sp. 18066]